MPKRSPFTLLCQTAAKLANPQRIDLHSHTTVSDGDFTPSQLVVQARNASLIGLAITDHDTTFAIAEARSTAAALTTRTVEIICGVEISTTWNGREYHLLGIGFDDNHRELQDGLAAIRERRRQRFKLYLDSFASNGVIIGEHLLGPHNNHDCSIGRRNLAKLLCEAGHANTLHIAFLKHIHPAAIPAMHSVPMEIAIRWVHDAGGFTSLAHPPQEITIETLQEMQRIGLDAVEANFPSGTYSHCEQLKNWARTLGIGVTAGSDYHGGSHVLGSRTISSDDWATLRDSTRHAG